MDALPCIGRGRTSWAATNRRSSRRAELFSRGERRTALKARYFFSASILRKCALCWAPSARHNSLISRVHAPPVTWGSIGIGVRFESTSASSAAVGTATIVFRFTISVLQKLKARGCHNALVSDARCEGNARRWTPESRRTKAANVMPMLEALKHASNVGQPAATCGHWRSAENCPNPTLMVSSERSMPVSFGDLRPRLPIDWGRTRTSLPCKIQGLTSVNAFARGRRQVMSK
jgi:hypothetical protein